MFWNEQVTSIAPLSNLIAISFTIINTEQATGFPALIFFKFLITG